MKSLEAALEATRRKRRGGSRTRSPKSKTADWVAIRALYLAGMPSQDLEKKFGVSSSYIRSKASTERWLEVAVEKTPQLVVDQITKRGGEKTAKLISECWAERGEMIREKEFVVAEKIARHAEEMDEDSLINKIDKVKTAFDMGRRASGLDKVESNPNAVNIAVLGEIGLFDREAQIYSSKQVDKP
jgi:uncharacterized protein YjcR